MKQKKVPLRMCVGCQELKPKKELLRIVKNKEDKIFIDPTGKQNGRGAYICAKASCLEKARKTRRLERTFETKIDEELYKEIEQNAEGNDGQ